MATARCTWTAVSGVDGYNVYLKSNGTFVKQNSELITETVYDIENLEAGNYEAYATALIGALESDPSNVDGFVVALAGTYAVQVGPSAGHVLITDGNAVNLPVGDSPRRIEVECMILSVLDRNKVLVGHGQSGTGINGIFFYNKGTNTLAFWGGGTGYNVSINLNLDIYEWYKIAVSYDGDTTIKFYVDDVLVGTEDINASLNTSASPICIGNLSYAPSTTTSQMHMLVRSVKMWDVENPSSGVGNVINAVNMAGIGTALEDSSGNENDLNFDGSDIKWVEYAFDDKHTDFSDTNIDEIPGGWVKVCNSGMDWKVIDTSGIGGIGGKSLSCVAPTSGWSSIEWDALGNLGPCEVDIRWRSTVRPTIGPAINLPDGFGADGASTTIRLFYFNAACGITAQQSTSTTVPLNEWLRFKIRIDASGHRLKYWKDGDSEPVSWTLTSTAGRTRVFGKMGLVFWGAGTHYVDDVTVRSLPIE